VSKAATLTAVLDHLEHIDVITTRPEQAAECCGLPRDEEGRCFHRPGHPVYVERPREPSVVHIQQEQAPPPPQIVAVANCPRCGYRGRA
jgi:hypothetical protein